MCIMCTTLTTLDEHLGFALIWRDYAIEKGYL